MNFRRPLLALTLLLQSVVATADEPCRGEQRDDPRWFDRAQGYFSQQACTPAVWFDRFFGDQREDEIASAFVRVIPTIDYNQREHQTADILLKARVNLPNLEDKLSLVFDDTGSETSGTTGDSAVPSPGTSEDRSTAALRYLMRLADDSRIDVDVGLRSRLKFFTRGRYIKRVPLASRLQTRFTQTVFFLDGEGFGETSLAELEYQPLDDVLVRYSSQATISEELDGLELGNGVRIYRQLDANRAVSWGIGGAIRSAPEWRDTHYFTSVRYRLRLFRPWFFVEAEPYIDWSEIDRFNSNPGITLRTEIWLGDTRRAGDGINLPPPSPPPPEVTSPTSDDPAAAPAASQ